jgi:hypothetical protein
MTDTEVDVHGIHGTAVDKITASTMVEKGKLVPFADFREKVAATEPLSFHGFDAGEAVQFKVQPGWNHELDKKSDTATLDASITIGPKGSRTELLLTKEALLEATSNVSIPKGYAAKLPAKLLQDQLNYWYQGGVGPNRSYKAMQAGNSEIAVAVTRGSIQPYSNVRLLEEIEGGIRKQYGNVDLYVDYKNHHSLRKTYGRIIVPEQARQMVGTGRENDVWSVGVNFTNSLVGELPTQLDGYLFAWWCTNGAIDLHSSSGKWSRRGAAGDDVYEWAKAAVDDVLGGLEPSLDAVQALVDVPLEGEAMQVLRDIFEQYRVPAPQREEVIKFMVDNDQLNMYAVMNAITQAANRADVPQEQVRTLMEIGGDLPRAIHHRCDGCHRMLPEAVQA